MVCCSSERDLPESVNTSSWTSKRYTNSRLHSWYATSEARPRILTNRASSPGGIGRLVRGWSHPDMSSAQCALSFESKYGVVEVQQSCIQWLESRGQQTTTFVAMGALSIRDRSTSTLDCKTKHCRRIYWINKNTLQALKSMRAA